MPFRYLVDAVRDAFVGDYGDGTMLLGALRRGAARRRVGDPGHTDLPQGRRLSGLAAWAGSPPASLIYPRPMVNLTRIYTRTGDKGTTALGDMSRTAKTDTRIAAYADANEANAAIGVALALGGLPEELAAVLTRVQNDLFDVGADLATPVVENPEFPPLRVEQSYVDKLEADCDRFLEEPGEAAQLHPARRHARARRCCTRPARWSAAPSAPPGRPSRSTARS